MKIGLRNLLVAAAALLAVATSSGAEETAPLWNSGFGFRGVACSIAAIPDVPDAYYGIEMVPTKRIPGTGSSTGLGRVTFAESPYGVSVTPDGSYHYDLELSLSGLKYPSNGVLTAWVTRSDLSETKRLGVLDDDFRISGRVEWNRFLVVVSLESSAEPTDSWQGPIVLRGMSRSGMMHTMAGHGPFEKEPCAKYGF